MFCRKRSCTDSPPPVEVTVKRWVSCPETSKPPGALLNAREPPRLLTSFFSTKKSSRWLPGGKWSSFEDVSLRFLRSQPQRQLGKIDEGDQTSTGFISNPLYLPPDSKQPSLASSTKSQTQASDEPIKPSPKPSPQGLEDGRDPEQLPTQLDEKADGPEMSLVGRFIRKDSCRWERKESRFVHTQPLYQDYWVFYRKADPGVTHSLLSVDTPMSFADFISSSLIEGSTDHVNPRDYTSFLWQELAEVKRRRILETITPQQRQLQEAIFEVVTSEASYQRSLSVAVNHFQKSRKLSDCLVTSDRHTLFSNLSGVKEVSERFLLDLEDGLERDLFLSEIGELVLRHCPAFHRVYIPYVTNQMFQEKLMQQLVRENGRFLEVLRRLEEQPLCKRQPLKSFLVLPFQRITRLKILLENILKLAQNSFELASSVRSALVVVGQIVSACNEGVRRMMETEELVLLEKRVEFLNTKAIPIISRGRVLLQHGELVRIFFQELGVGYRPRLSTKPLYLHLFSDLLLLSSRTDDGRFLVKDYASRGQVKADNLKAKQLGLPDLTFLLRLQPNQAGVNCEVVLKASCETEKQQWISVISSQMSSESNC
ncbi:rho guanine nucleotide exchange factor 19-like [Rhinophrynus dorsalis]